jgi:hypothetical protein
VAAGEAVAGDLDAADSATAGAAAGDVVSPDLDTTDSADLAAEAAESLVPAEPAVPAAAPEPVEVAADAAEPVTEVDVLTPDGSGVATVEGTVTDEGVAAVDTPQESDAAEGPATEVTADLDAGAAGEGAVATDEGGGEVAAATPVAGGTAPVEGYDAWSIAQLRGRMRGYQAKTVQELLSYEEATRAREPYLRMLRNRLEKLDEQAVEASPLAPRGV